MHPPPTRPGSPLFGVVPVLAAALTLAVPGHPGHLEHKVRPGDTLWGLSRQYHVPVGRIAEINKLTGREHRIHAGATLWLPPTVAPAPAVRGRSTEIRYRIRYGDTLSAIAHRHHTPARLIAARNRLPASGLIRSGQTLHIPLPAPSAQPGRAGAGSLQRTQVRALITRTARAHHVDPALALAVAWQESGWNQHRVSPAGAIGVMQVLPSTGRWVSRLTGRPLNLHETGDNVLAGIVFLRILMRNNPRHRAIAGYYQGPASLRRHGVHPDTRRYVANVLALQNSFR